MQTLTPCCAPGKMTAPAAVTGRTKRRGHRAIFVLACLLIAGGLALFLSGFVKGSGPAPADAQALASARSKLSEQVGNRAAFRLELTEDEITAVLQDGLQESGAPFQRVMVKVIGRETEHGHMQFKATFRNGDLAVRGRADVLLENGVARIKVDDVEMGTLDVPGLAKDAVEDLINPFAAQVLAKHGTVIQSVALANHKMIIVGTQADGNVLSSATLVAGLRQQIASSALKVATPPEKLGRGIVKERHSEGPSYYVALGDSLAANVGVADPRDGYVARFHNQLQQRDGVQYGLRNFGVSGETSTTLIRNGQLVAALQFIRTHEVRYITLDIGANDLLGHIGRVDCSDDLDSPACQKGMAAAFTVYEANLDRILDELRMAAPDATVIFLQAYNPLNLGFGVQVTLEGRSDRLVTELNSLAAAVAKSHQVRIADGFTPMQGTAAATTHMLDKRPNVHPRAIGFDILAVALLDTLPRLPQKVRGGPVR